MANFMNTTIQLFCLNDPIKETPKSLHKAAKIPQTTPTKKKKKKEIILTLEEPDFVSIRL